MAPNYWNRLTSSKCILREYTIKFGRCLVDLFGNLVSTAHGQPSLPPAVPVAQASFDALPDAGFDLGYARLWEAYGYIRRGKQTPGHSGRMERAVAKAFMMEFHHLRYRYQRYSSQHLRTCRGSVMEQTMDWILFTHKNVDIFTRTNPKSETYRLNICNNILH